MANILCTKCKNYKSENSFRKRKELKRGRQSWCKDCENKANKKRYVPKKKQHKKQKSPDIVKRNARNRMLNHRYGIGIDEYENMYKIQGGKCKICNTYGDNGGVSGLYVDHCHKTGSVRGLLCPRCNSLLGRFLDDESLLERAIKYLNDDKERTN